MAEDNGTKQQVDVHIQLYKAYLEDLGRIGGRHENTRKFYMSVMSALFVFLSMAGKGGPFINVQGPALIIVGVVGILMCIAWFEHMRSFGKIYGAKFGTLRRLEEDLEKDQSLKPFIVETEILQNPDQKDAGDEPSEWRYIPITMVDAIAPAVSGL